MKCITRIKSTSKDYVSSLDIGIEDCCGIKVRGLLKDNEVTTNVY